MHANFCLPVCHHGVTNGDVSFDGESCDGEGGQVDAEVLEEDHDTTPHPPKDVLVDDQEVIDDGRQRGEHEKEDVGDGQRY